MEIKFFLELIPPFWSWIKWCLHWALPLQTKQRSCDFIEWRCNFTWLNLSLLYWSVCWLFLGMMISAMIFTACSFSHWSKFTPSFLKPPNFCQNSLIVSLCMSVDSLFIILLNVFGGDPPKRTRLSCQGINRDSKNVSVWSHPLAFSRRGLNPTLYRE